ncbi:MAG TPA: thioesterase family protein [Polyangiaceae bacterium]|nr:thioesterase family protein [Polyangiaceae bacterium]
MDKKELSAAKAPVFSARSSVRFQHVDAAGVVFFARYFEYVHEAYEGFLSAVGTPLSQVLKEQSWAAPLSHVEADYFRPLRLGDELHVQLVAAEIDGSRLTLGWRLVIQPKPEVEHVVAVVQSTHSFVKMDDFSRTAIPEPIVQAISPVWVRDGA